MTLDLGAERNGSDSGAGRTMPRTSDRSDKAQQTLKDEISSVQLQLEDMSQRHARLKRELNDRFCPILQLPPDISTEIFSERHPEGIWENIWYSPFTLGQVCGNWRTIAKSSPEIWCTISFEIKTTKLELCQEWLVRSGNHPLAIRLIVHPGGFPYDPATIQIMETLTRTSERWRKIGFILPHHNLGLLSPI